jgi:hypothetical protein
MMRVYNNLHQVNYLMKELGTKNTHGVDVCGGFTPVDPAQVLQTSIPFSCLVFASYLFPVLVSVVYH